MKLKLLSIVAMLLFTTNAVADDNEYFGDGILGIISQLPTEPIEFFVENQIPDCNVFSVECPVNELVMDIIDMVNDGDTCCFGGYDNMEEVPYEGDEEDMFDFYFEEGCDEEEIFDRFR